MELVIIHWISFMCWYIHAVYVVGTSPSTCHDHVCVINLEWSIPNLWPQMTALKSLSDGDRGLLLILLTMLVSCFICCVDVTDNLCELLFCIYPPPHLPNGEVGEKVKKKTLVYDGDLICSAPNHFCFARDFLVFIVRSVTDENRGRHHCVGVGGRRHLAAVLGGGVLLPTVQERAHTASSAVAFRRWVRIACVLCWVQVGSCVYVFQKVRIVCIVLSTSR